MSTRRRKGVSLLTGLWSQVLFFGGGTPGLWSQVLSHRVEGRVGYLWSLSQEGYPTHLPGEDQDRVPPPRTRTGVSPLRTGHTTNRIQRGRWVSCVFTQEDFLVLTMCLLCICSARLNGTWSDPRTGTSDVCRSATTTTPPPPGERTAGRTSGAWTE